jgi:hypothetical protein
MLLCFELNVSGSDTIILEPSWPSRLIFKAASNLHQTNGFSDSIALLEECLPWMGENLPRRAMGGHWDLNTLHAGVMLVKIRLELESHETAKALIAKRFLGAYYKYFGELSSPGADYLHATPSTGSTDNQRPGQQSQANQDNVSVKGWSWLSEEFAEVSEMDMYLSVLNSRVGVDGFRCIRFCNKCGCFLE